jgi:hypothetical protein
MGRNDQFLVSAAGSSIITSGHDQIYLDQLDRFQPRSARIEGSDHFNIHYFTGNTRPYRLLDGFIFIDHGCFPVLIRHKGSNQSRMWNLRYLVALAYSWLESSDHWRR